ncbi:TraR/DksA family transcriptional regulator [Streptomyces sp. NBC_00249]|uniref:TraR/DksA family transcriptional regulator n=1 Tax=Streptomyces sp. NBC_00249 TaxID=2975690 RepID=UPI0022502E05|nr:TraR/DksA family transcriptional regulator [Streptomyces sp. NBC_00249]MCX5196773.1 TraR/DksA family transcriptional regulator [Streptomyces sp. NBC_00249]
MVAKKTATQEVAAVPGSTPAAKRAAPAKKAAAKKAAAAERTPAAKKAPAKKAVKAAAKKVAAADGTAAAVKSTTSKAAAEAAGAEGAAPAARKTGARKVVAKKTAGTARKTASAGGGLPKARGAQATPPGELAVRPGEDPWTETEVEEARTELLSEVLRLRAELDASEVAITGLMRDSGDGAGDDQADTGTKNITRESELALAANATSMLEQTERALERLEAGTYGLCENCGQPIGKARMQAFPRATLCVDCKQKQERRH